MKTCAKRLTVFLFAAATFSTGILHGAPGKAQVTPWQYDILSVDTPGFQTPCLDETLRIVADWPIRWREVNTPSGGYHYTFQFTPATPSGGGYYYLEGEDSGTIYHSQNGMPAHEMIHVGPGEIYRFRSHERYVAEDGTRLTIDWHFQFTVNANGDVVVDIALFDCRVQ
ncbi:MAG: hypothetical protein HS113_06655 [Verrucomicrobiales bacterium]|nr:hypothetical protein [Verrucomicrobiales bacterium]